MNQDTIKEVNSPQKRAQHKVNQSGVELYAV